MLADQLNVFGNVGMMSRMGLDKRPLCSEERAVQSRLVKLLFELNLNFAALRVDSKANLSELAPHSWFGVCSDDTEEAKQCFLRMREECAFVRNAAEVIETLPPGSDAHLT